MIKNLLRDIVQKTPLFFHDHTLEHFPKVMQDFFNRDNQKEPFYTDASNNQYKIALKKKVDEDINFVLKMNG